MNETPMTPEQMLLSHFKQLDLVTDYIEQGGSGAKPDHLDYESCPITAWFRENINEEFSQVHKDFHTRINEAADAMASGDGDRAKKALDEAYVLLVRLEKYLLNV